MLAALDTLRTGTPARRLTPVARARRGVVQVVFSATLLGLVAVGSGWPQGADADHAVLRLGWRLAGQIEQRCRDLAPDELARRPVHMRQAQECVSEVPTYDLRAAVDGVVLVERRVTSPGLRADRPLTVEENIRVVPGDHEVTITFVPEAARRGRPLSLTRRLRFERQRVVLITYDGEALIVRGEP